MITEAGLQEVLGMAAIGAAQPRRDRCAGCVLDRRAFRDGDRAVELDHHLRHVLIRRDERMDAGAHPQAAVPSGDLEHHAAKAVP